MTKRRRSADYISTLVYVDEPYLLLLQSGKSKVVAVAIDAEGDFPFFATLISENDWNLYARETVDLRYLFTFAKPRHAYTFDLGKLKDNKILMSAWDEDVSPEEYLPSPRFFARDHTEDMPSAEIYVSDQIFNIDGSWDLPDFSYFYSRYSDMYAFNISLSNLANDNVDHEVKRSIIKAFTRYPWRGGSSYMHFYHDLYKAQPANDKLGVNSLKYASPGHVSIRGRKDVFDKVKSDIENFGRNYLRIRTEYELLRKFLSGADLLKYSGGLVEVRSQMGIDINKKVDALAALLQIQAPNQVKQLCENDPLITAKVLMSYYRRTETAFRFFAEGRVQFQNISDEHAIEVAAPRLSR